MTSPATRRKKRLARVRTAEQAENRRWNKLNLGTANIVHSTIPVPDNLRDVTPKKMLALSGGE